MMNKNDEMMQIASTNVNFFFYERTADFEKYVTVVIRKHRNKNLNISVQDLASRL